jgi:hypothetical protein
MIGVIIITTYAIGTFLPSYEEHFFTMAILDENKRAEHYYPNNNSSINNNTTIRWNIHIFNDMKDAQDVSIKVKVINSTQIAPNDFMHQPAQATVLAEFFLHLDDKTSQLIPYSWSFPEVFYSHNLVSIPFFVVNDEMIKMNESAISDGSFRMIFELWVYNKQTEEYGFSWKSGNEDRSLSLWMMFYVPLPEAFRSLFYDGFESGTTSAWTRVTGNPLLTTNIVHSGRYALSCENIEGVTKIISENSSTIFVRMYFSLSMIPPDISGTVLLRAYDDYQNELYNLHVENRGSTLRLQLVRHFPYNTNNEFLCNLTANTWYCIEVKSHLNSTQAEYRLYLDDKEIIKDITLYSTERTELPLLRRVRIGQLSSSYLVTINFDDISINDRYIGPLDSP